MSVTTPPTRNRRSWLPASYQATLGILALIALAYLLTARGSLAFVQPEGIAAVWFPSGLALAILLLFPRRDWGKLLAAIFLANVGANMWGGNALPVSIGFAIGNTLEPAIGAWLFVRWAGDAVRFTRLKDVGGLFIIAIVSPAVAGLVGAWVPVLAFGANYWNVWFTWVIPDALGIFLLTPFVVTWATSPTPRLPAVGRLIEIVVLFTLIIVGACVIFAANPQSIRFLRAYMVLPFLIWAALRFTLRGTSSAVLVMSAITIWGTAHNLGLFADPAETVHANLLMSQIFLSVSAAMALTIAVIFTERRLAENSLRESEANLRQMYENTPLGYQSLDANGSFIEVNPVWCAILGYSRDQVIGKWFGDFLAPSQVELFRQRFPRFKQLGEIHNVEFEMVRQDGAHIFVQFDGKVGHNAHGEFKQTHCILHDLTARKNTEDALRAKTAELDRYFQTSLDLLCIADMQGYFRRLNPEWANVLGYTLDDLEGKQFIDFVHPDDRPATLAELARLGENKNVLNFVNRYRCKDGTYRWIEWRSFPQGETIYAVARDITERKQSEQAIQASEARYRSLFENMLDGYAYCQMIYENGQPVDFIYLDVNKAFGELTGLRDVIGKRVTQVIPRIGEDTPELFETYGRVAQTGKPEHFEIDFTPLDIWLSISVYSPTVGYFVAVFDNITERKRAEAQLRQSEEKFAKAFFTSPDAVNINRLRDGLYIEINRGFTELSGYTADDVRGKTSAEINIWVDPADRERLVQGLRERGEYTNLEAAFRIKDGTVKICLMSATIITINDEPCILSITRDITARQRAEEQFRAVLQTANDAIISEDNAGNVLFWNRAAENIFGYTAAEMTGKPLNLILPPRFRELHWQGLQDTLTNGKLNADGKSVELIGMAKDGREFPIELSLAQWQTHNGTFFTAIVRDIRARKRIEAELRESEASLKFSQQVAHVGHWTWDTQTNRLVWSDEMYRIFGIDPQTFTGDLAHVIDQAIHPDDRAIVHASNNTVLTEQKPAPIEYRVVWADGSVHNVWAVPGAKTTDEHGKILKLSGIVQDITARKQVEERIHASEISYRDLFNSVAEAIYVQNRDGVFIDVNRGAELMYGYRREEMIGKTPAFVSAPGKNNLAQVQQVVARAFAGETQHFEFWGQRANGEIFPKDVRLTPGTYAGQSVIIAIATDITDRKKRERELEAIAAVTAALRTATTRDDMMPLIVEQTTGLLNTTAAAIGLYDGYANQSIIQYANGKLADAIGHRFPVNQGISHYILTQKQPYVADHLADDPLCLSRDLNGEIHGIGCMPLIANDQVIGWLFAGVRTPFSDSDLRILQAIADIAASAINRATLHEQTQERLRRLDALQIIDRTINASLDLQVTLGILVNQVISQLNVDAATVLLFNRQSRMLTCAAAKGFRKHGIVHSTVQLGSDAASRAILERRLIQISNLNETPGALGRVDRLANEGFVSYYALPLVAKGQVKGVLEIFQRTRHTPQPDWLEFSKALAEQAAIAVDNGELFADLQHSNDELIVAYDTTIEGWARALDLRDKETEGHTRRVVENTLRLARVMGIKEDQMVHIQRGALLHDIGKMGIPDAILFKPGALTPAEWEIMRMHPVYAQQLLSSIPYLQPAVDISYCHHEKWDGTGYPRGLQGEAIPLPARIFAIVDVWDALRSDRPYRPAWSDEKIYAYLREQSGKHFDPRVVEAFLTLLQKA